MTTPRGNRPFYEAVTPDQLATAVRRIRGGAPLDSVLCAEFGCSDRAARRFRTEGKRVADLIEEDGAELTPREKKAFELWTAINKAWYEAELMMLDEIRKAEKVTVETTVAATGKTSTTTRRQVVWQARAWLLERTRRETYALNQAPHVDLAAPTGDTSLDRAADLRAYAAARGLTLVGASEPEDTYDPLTATRGQ